MYGTLWVSIGWIIAACTLGFAISAIFAGKLKFPRHRFLIPYVCLASVFLFSFVLLHPIDMHEVLVKNWIWGLLAGVLASIFLVKTVRDQPFTRRSSGREFVFEMTWAGLIYGVMDALFLNVMPVITVWIGVSQFAWTTSIPGKIIVGTLGLFASLLVTLAYHLGYPEFRNRKVILVLVGNLIITLAFLLSGNPLGSILSHAVMHIAAILQGSETTIQLPPHHQTV